jgi:hypothetical protein
MPRGPFHAFISSSRRRMAVTVILLWVLAASLSAQTAPSSSGAVERAHVDSLTTILDIADYDVSVTRFIPFRAPAEANLASRLVFVQPVEGAPRDITAQIMSVGAFERSYVSTRKTEQAFYAQAVSTGKVRQCLFVEIGMNGGLPAWPILWKSWSTAAPAITAVTSWDVPASTGDLHAVADLQVLPLSMIDALPSSLRQPTRSAVEGLKDPYLIVVSMAPALSFDDPLGHPATAGLRLSCTVPLSAGEDQHTVQLPPMIGDYSGTVPLMRTYVVAPPGIAVSDRWDPPAASVMPQQLVNEALDVLSLRVKRNLPSTRVATSTRLMDNTCIHRRVATSEDSRQRITLLWQESGMGVLGALRRTVGELLVVGLWPVTCVLYLIGVWWSRKAYLWLIGTRETPDSPKRFALCAVLFPVLTPWLLLRYSEPASARADADDADALSVLPLIEFDALARLIVAALLVAVNWAALESVARLGMWLRFG